MDKLFDGIWLNRLFLCIQQNLQQSSVPRNSADLLTSSTQASMHAHTGLNTYRHVLGLDDYRKRLFFIY